VEIELVPDPGTDDPASRAAHTALVGEGMAADERPAAYDGAWRRAGLLDGVERGVGPSSAATTGALEASAGYVPPARSTVGATRA
jgi:hypothetical protein